jgi:hypothetical protein
MIYVQQMVYVVCNVTSVSDCQDSDVSVPTMIDNVCIAADDPKAFCRAVRRFLRRSGEAGTTLKERGGLTKESAYLLAEAGVSSGNHPTKTKVFAESKADIAFGP